jgi:peptidoglycan hydrolase-like protein with peptidoglycan-binding domain
MTTFNIYETLIKELLVEGDAAGTTEVIFNPEMTDLKMKSLGNDVKAWQWALVALGYDLGEFGKKGDGVDGKFGPETDRATREFQKDYRTTEDGIVGDRTLTLMNAILVKKGIKEVPGYKKSKLPVKPVKTNKEDEPINNEKKRQKKKSKSSIPGDIANAKIVFQGMKQLGFNDIQAAAWIGCIAGESGFNPTIVGKEKNEKTGKRYESYGICQWNLDRWEHLKKFAKDKTGSINGWDDLSLQIEFIGEELKGSYYGKLVTAPLKRVEDSLEKSLWILVRYYENPKFPEAGYNKRLPWARAALEEFSEKSAEADQETDTIALDTSSDTVPTSLAENVELDRIKHLSKILLG